ncbi:exo-alpha-sialidase [Jiangella aurantiaca]|uniref:Exo-alpha-sialidase n=1 Tax=Jiangella aurantiaca TaxID=2530373 RepID=A0A4R5AC85_9ACTN|nr:exo-alpha-sialidase [Jiangella aurantiaca]TDD69841.1 exo-alpha-sialidase [Jiangella aurantiaca]
MTKRCARLPAAIAAAGLLLAGCGDDGDSAGDADTGATAEAHVGEPFDHIHGLGMVDDVLYVATHNGLFAVSPDGRASAASSDDHDFMGFTVADTGEFLASGHPNSRTDLPPNLGLLESSDRGATWNTLSLSGEVDFHTLDAKAGTVYGYDSGSGELLTTTDRETWTSLGQIPLADVAINPDDAASVLVTTEQGPQLSTDGGRTFAVVEGAPVVMLAEWPHADEVYGIAPDGAVHVSVDGGVTWEERAGLGGPPQAMTVAHDGAIYVALEGSIVASSDGGERFEPYYTWG